MRSLFGYIIWEITFYGNEEDMKERGSELFEYSDKVIKKLKAEKSQVSLTE